MAKKLKCEICEEFAEVIYFSKFEDRVVGCENCITEREGSDE